jgi:hypothetical protein
LIRGAATPRKSTYRAQLLQTGAGELQSASELAKRARLARTVKRVQIFGEIPPLGCACNQKRGGKSNN